ncbi:porin [Microbulbifer sp. TYP-18]|uniref:porin n=1 Tax=Microbulbifer sp. TYP-18 TaxID=3230024 RepID=UPI0034C5C190
MDICKGSAGALAVSLVAGTVQAVPIFESDEATLYMEGYFAVHQVNANGDTAMQDGASRLRFGLDVPVYGDWDVGFNLEWGVAAISSTGDLIISGNQQVEVGERGESLYLRQGHLFANHDCWGEFAAGKQWSVYYDVAQITDWYNVGGGLASGAFTLGSDGGLTGTGRADSALTWRRSWDGYGGEIQLGLQYAAHVSTFDVDLEDFVAPDTLLVCPDDDCEFGLHHGISFTYDADVGDGLFVGAAYTRTKLDLSTGRGELFDISDPEDPILITDRFMLRESTNAFAASLGFAYGKGPFEKGFYGAVVGQNSHNNEVVPPGLTDEILIDAFDAKGSESFFSYTWGARDCYSIYGGHNRLKSDDPEFEEQLVDEDEFLLEIIYVGFSYQWNERVRIYWENAFDNSNDIALPAVGDFIAVGMRVDI